MEQDTGPERDSVTTTQPSTPVSVDPITTVVEGPAADSAEPAVCCGLLRNLASLPAMKRYRPIRKLAQGGSAHVLEVWDANLGRRVAMKVSNVRLDGTSETCLHQSRDPRISRFVGEAAVICHLDHPGVVSVHEIGLDRKRRLYFIMGLVDGETLESVLRKSRDGTDGWSLNRALTVLISVCETLGYAHSRGVVHRDVKPANVMVGSHGRVYVMDWGVAHVDGSDLLQIGTDRLAPPIDVGLGPPVVIALRHADRRNTPDGALLGTLCYMPLEQAEGHAAGRTSRVDVYAVGAMLYQLLSGRAPYEEISTGSTTLLDAMRDGPPTPLGVAAPDAPRELVAICDKAMAREPGERYADMAELADDLRAWLQHRTVKAFRTSWFRKLTNWGARNPSSAAWCATALTALSVLLGVALAFALRLV